MAEEKAAIHKTEILVQQERERIEQQQQEINKKEKEVQQEKIDGQKYIEEEVAR